MAIDFVSKYVALCKAGLPIDKVPEKFRNAVIACLENSR